MVRKKELRREGVEKRFITQPYQIRIATVFGSHLLCWSTLIGTLSNVRWWRWWWWWKFIVHFTLSPALFGCVFAWYVWWLHFNFHPSHPPQNQKSHNEIHCVNMNCNDCWGKKFSFSILQSLQLLLTSKWLFDVKCLNLSHFIYQLFLDSYVGCQGWRQWCREKLRNNQRDERGFCREEGIKEFDVLNIFFSSSLRNRPWIFKEIFLKD